MNSFDKFTEFTFGLLDRAGQGVKAYFDGRITLNEYDAQLALSEAQLNAAEQLAQLERGSSASNWANPDILSGSGIEINPQTLLIAAAVGLVAVAAFKK